MKTARACYATMIVCAGALTILLTACGVGSGGGSSTPIPDSVRARELAGGTAPIETAAQASVRGGAIASRTDSILVTDLLVHNSDPRIGTRTLDASCQGTSCSFREPRTGSSSTVRLRDLGSESGLRVRPVMTRNGITTLLVSGTTAVESAGTVHVETYGAWMEHATFSIQTSSRRIEGVSVSLHGGVVGGDMTRSRPAAINATWNGLMVGTPRSAGRGNVLQGDARLTFTADGPGNARLDAAFTDIVDLTRGARHTVSAIRFDDIPVTPDGTYRQGAGRSSIQAGFYGRGHAETAGVFEQRGVIGAFGATRRK